MKNMYCDIFRDLYRNYSLEDVESETKEWMDNHLSSCPDCRKWILKKCTEDEKAVSIPIEDASISPSEVRLIKRVRLLMFAGILFVILFTLWMSIWLFI